MKSTPDADGVATTPEPPYYAVIFTSRRTSIDDAGYARMAEHMADLAARQPGFLAVESARSADGVGITVSYWRDAESVAAWKNVGAHRAAQRAGIERWYERYEVRICRVERAYSMSGRAEGGRAEAHVASPARDDATAPEAGAENF